jgi:hypothetical protein
LGKEKNWSTKDTKAIGGRVKQLRRLKGRGHKLYYIYRMSQEEMSIFSEVILLVILSKKVYMYT